MYKKQKNLHSPFVFTFDDQGFTIKGDGVGGSVEWPSLLRALITDDLMLLYQNDLLFHMVMRRHFSEDEYLQIQKFASEKIETVTNA